MQKTTALIFYLRLFLTSNYSCGAHTARVLSVGSGRTCFAARLRVLKDIKKKKYYCQLAQCVSKDFNVLRSRSFDKKEVLGLSLHF